MSDEIRVGRKWDAEHLVPGALSFVFEEVLESLRASDVGTEELTLTVNATRRYSEDVDTPYDYTWEIQINGYAGAEWDDEALLDCGRISEEMYVARVSRRDTGDTDNER